MAGMSFCFLGPNSTTTVLPVTPEKYEWSVGKSVERLTLTELGEVVLPGPVRRHSGKLECMFPAHNYPFMQPGASSNPMSYVALFEKWAKEKTPVRYIVAGGGVNARVLISEFRYGMRDGSGDIYAVISMEEFVDPEAPEVFSAGDGAGDSSGREREDQTAQQQYTIVRGDTLSAICRRYYGKSSATYYNALAKYNGIANPHLIYPGRTITVPAESVLLGG